jgi:hypothetical protein
MANRSSIQRASSSGVRAVLVVGPIDVVAFKPPTSDIVAVTGDRLVPLPYFVSPGRNLSIKQGVPTPLFPIALPNCQVNRLFQLPCLERLQ